MRSSFIIRHEEPLGIKGRLSVLKTNDAAAITTVTMVIESLSRGKAPPDQRSPEDPSGGQASEHEDIAVG